MSTHPYGNGDTYTNGNRHTNGKAYSGSVYSQSTHSSSQRSIDSFSSAITHTTTVNSHEEVPVPPARLSRSLSLHPDFRGDGDVVLVCSDEGELVGFRVSSGMLRMAR